ncbi:MAG: hypothetical protein HQL33_01570 [Alphaproteobacteria bacterium]|nr:hypothetical protein [Alphaproteobacteria bacterium]
MPTHIQIGDTAPRAQYTANGTQTVFPYPFAIFLVSDLEVYLADALQSSGYAVSGAGADAGGNVTFAAAPASGAVVTLRRRLAIRRTTDFQDNGLFRAKVINDELDYQTAAIQQVADDVTLALKRSPTAIGTVDLTVPEPAAGCALKWNAAADGLVNSAGDADAVLTQAQAAATAAAADRDIVAADKATVATDKAAAAVSAGNAAASEANAAASAARLSGTSATSIAIGTGSQVFSTQSGKFFDAGAWLLIVSAANPANFMQGQVTSYNGTGLTVNVTETGGSGTHADWTIRVSGTRGATGATGAQGPQGPAGTGDLLSTNNLSDVASAAAARTNLGLAIGSDVQAFDAATAKTNQPQSFTKSQHAAPVAVTSSGGHIALDLSLSNVFTHTMTENTVLDNPTGMTAGRAVHLIVTQHASSPKTMAFGGYWKFAGGTAPALTAANGAVDVLSFLVEGATRISLTALKDTK